MVSFLARKTYACSPQEQQSHILKLVPDEHSAHVGQPALYQHRDPNCGAHMRPYLPTTVFIVVIATRKLPCCSRPGLNRFHRSSEHHLVNMQTLWACNNLARHKRRSFSVPPLQMPLVGSDAVSVP